MRSSLSYLARILSCPSHSIQHPFTVRLWYSLYYYLAKILSNILSNANTGVKENTLVGSSATKCGESISFDITQVHMHTQVRTMHSYMKMRMGMTLTLASLFSAISSFLPHTASHVFVARKLRMCTSASWMQFSVRNPYRTVGEMTIIIVRTDLRTFSFGNGIVICCVALRAMHTHHYNTFIHVLLWSQRRGFSGGSYSCETKSRKK